MTESALTVTRSRKVRIFKKLETLVRYLKDLGLSRLDVNAANYDPAGGRVLTRPDTSAALKRAHAAAAHDTWLRAQVERALQEADDPASPVDPAPGGQGRHGAATRRSEGTHRPGDVMQWVWTPQATGQRHEAIDYIAQDNLHVALDQLDRIEQQTDTLLAHSKLVRPGRQQSTPRSTGGR